MSGSSGRLILRTDLEPMDLLDELATGAVTDGRGLTLGDVAGHRRDRCVAVAFAVHLAAGLGRHRLLKATDSVRAIGAEVQDKTGIEDFQAAHVLPCDFDINGREGLHLWFSSPIIRGNVQVHVFGRTNVVHRLVNYADRRCEATGWIAAFRQAILQAVRDGDADAGCLRDLFSSFAATVLAARNKLLADITPDERNFMNHGRLLAANSQPAQNRVPDFRVTKKLADPRQRVFNKQAVQRVYDEYLLGFAGVAPAEFAAVRKKAADWIELEMDWRAKYGAR